MASQEHLTALADAMMAYDNAVKNMIRDELEQFRPGLEQTRDAAVERLRVAYEALKLPLEQLAETDTEIRAAEKELDSYREDLESESVDARIKARIPFEEWEKELAKLQAKKSRQEEGLQPFRDEHASAKDASFQAVADIEALDISISAPFLGTGRYTQAYQAFRIGSFPMWQTLIGNNDSHPEYDAFVESLDSVCQATGYRTDDLAERLRQQAVAEQQELFARTPAPAPSGAEVVAETAGSLKYQAENAKPNTQVIEDYRTRNSIPRNSVVRDYLRLPEGGR